MVGAIEPGLCSLSATLLLMAVIRLRAGQQRTVDVFLWPSNDSGQNTWTRKLVQGGGDVYLLRCILFITRRTVAETIIANRVYDMQKLIVDVAYVIKNYGEMCTLLSHCCINHTLCIINRAYNPRVLIILINRRHAVFCT